jgi:prevent-host-death family protein
VATPPNHRSALESVARPRMKTVSETDAKSQFDAILDEAQHAPVVIRRKDQDIAVVVSMADYERLRAGHVRAFLKLRDEIATEATRSGLTEERLAELSIVSGR